MKKILLHRKINQIINKVNIVILKIKAITKKINKLLLKTKAVKNFLPILPKLKKFKKRKKENVEEKHSQTEFEHFPQRKYNQGDRAKNNQNLLKIKTKINKIKFKKML